MKIYSIFTKTGRTDVPIQEQNQNQAEAIAKNPVMDLMDKVRELTDLSNKLTKSQALELGNEVEKIEFTDIDGSKVTLRKGGPGSGRHPEGGVKPEIDDPYVSRAHVGSDVPMHQSTADAVDRMEAKDKLNPDGLSNYNSNRDAGFGHKESMQAGINAQDKPEKEEPKPASTKGNEWQAPKQEPKEPKVAEKPKDPFNDHKKIATEHVKSSVPLKHQEAAKAYINSDHFKEDVERHAENRNSEIKNLGYAQGPHPAIRALNEHLHPMMNKAEWSEFEKKTLQKFLDMLRDEAGNLAKGGPGSGRHYEGGTNAPYEDIDDAGKPSRFHSETKHGMYHTFKTPNGKTGVIFKPTGSMQPERMTGEFNSPLDANSAILRHDKELGKFQKGGPGSGCTGPDCGRPSTGGSKDEPKSIWSIPEGQRSGELVLPKENYGLTQSELADKQRMERLRTTKNPNNPFYEKPEIDPQNAPDVVGGKVVPPAKNIIYDDNSAQATADRLNREIKAPHVRASVSQLGGPGRHTVMLTVSKDPKEAWSNGIMENSNYGHFSIDRSGKVEHFAGNMPKIRQKNVKDVDSLITHLNSKINQDPSKAEEADDLEKGLTIDELRNVASKIVKVNSVSPEEQTEFDKERKEHPEFTDAQIWQIVSDHMKKGGPGSGRHYEGGSQRTTDGSEARTITAKDHPLGSTRQVMFGSGIASGKTGTVVHRSEIKTDGRGIPTNIEGAYKPVDWKNETAIKYHEGQGSMSGKYDTMQHARLKPVEGKPLGHGPQDPGDANSAQSEVSN